MCDSRARANQLELTDFHTGELGETFHGKTRSPWEHDDDLAELPVGLVELGGVAFDVRGVIQLRRAEPLGGGWELATLDDPVRVDGIPIQQEATRLHLLLGTARSETDGTVIGRLVLHYADGETRSLVHVEVFADDLETGAEDGIFATHVSFVCLDAAGAKIDIESALPKRLA